GYAVRDGVLAVMRAGGSTSGLKNPAQFVGFQGEAEAPSAVLLRHNGLHLEIRIDRSHPIGRDDAAGVADLVLESALTTIQDCEDLVA
ncbi:malate synthase G, partial [Escherichia coli]